MALADKEFSAKKNRNKRIRSLIEVIVLASLLYIIVNALFVFAKYRNLLLYRIFPLILRSVKNSFHYLKLKQ